MIIRSSFCRNYHCDRYLYSPTLFNILFELSNNKILFSIIPSLFPGPFFIAKREVLKTRFMLFYEKNNNNVEEHCLRTTNYESKILTSSRRRRQFFFSEDLVTPHSSILSPGLADKALITNMVRQRQAIRYLKSYCCC